MSRGGSHASFDAFFRDERDRLVGQAYVLTGDLHLAHDLVQQAFERAWRHWAKVERYESPPAWIRRVLFNLALNERRRIGREVALGEHHDGGTPDEEHLLVVEALRALPEPQRKALVLHHAVGLSVMEVAAELDVPVGTVKS